RLTLWSTCVSADTSPSSSNTSENESPYRSFFSTQVLWSNFRIAWCCSLGSPSNSFICLSIIHDLQFHIKYIQNRTQCFNGYISTVLKTMNTHVRHAS